jgi:hypothetical protein
MRAIILGISSTLVLSATVAWSQNLRVDGKLISTTPSGAPLEVASTAKVANLNADLLDGLDASSFAAAASLQTILQSLFHEVHFTGEGSFVVPGGVSWLEVTVIGGGGGGGGGFDESGGGTGWIGAGGGGGSGFVVVTTVSVLEKEALSITVGEGGVGGVGNADTYPGATSGTHGGTSTLASLDRPWRVEAAGGKGGTWANGGGKGGDGWFGGGGGAYGGAAGVGVAGNGGGGNGYFGGGGASGGAGLGDCSAGDMGGGGGGGPGGGAGGGWDGVGYAPAQPGAQPGAGGGGACSGAWDSPGGDGAPGTVVIRWVGLSGIG